MTRKPNHALDRERALAKAAEGQEGVVSLGQLTGVGISSRAAAYRNEVGRLHRVHRGVYAVGHESIGRLGELRAALLACGEGAVVSHQTAAALWGLTEHHPAQIDVTVPCEAGRKVDGIRCRRCRYPSEREIAEVSGITCTTPARIFVDLAGLLGFPSLRRLIEQAAYLGLLDLDDVNASLEEGKGRPGMRKLRRTLIPWYGDAGETPDLRSAFEARVLVHLVESGLPRPDCNVPLSVDGATLTVDFFWRTHRLVVETDGRTHDNDPAFQRDRWRDQLLVVADFRVFRVTWDQMKKERSALIARIARVLASPPDTR